MRNPKIIVRYKRKNPQHGNNSDREYSVNINGEHVKENTELDGCRSKFVKDNIIVKTDNEPMMYGHASRELKTYKKLRPEDRKYFPKLIAGSSHSGYIAQEFIKLKSPNKAKKSAKDIVQSLIDRYNISDIGVGRHNWNWGICARTGNPIIFDFGFMGSSD